MGIEDLLGMDAQTLAHEVNAIDEAALLFRIFRSFGAASVETGTSDPGRPLGAAGSVPGTHPGTDEVSDHISDPREPPLGPAGTPREVGRYVRRAQAGDRSSARRVAELLELAATMPWPLFGGEEQPNSATPMRSPTCGNFWVGRPRQKSSQQGHRPRRRKEA